MNCPHCQSLSTTEREGRTVHGFRRFQCRECGRRFNERTGTALNRLQVPTDIVFLFWRLRYKLSLRNLAEMFLIRGIVFTHEAVRDWEAKLAPRLAEGLRQRRAGNSAGTSMRRTSRSPAHGAICTGRSTATAIWSTFRIDASVLHGCAGWRRGRSVSQLRISPSCRINTMPPPHSAAEATRDELGRV
jgi:hypothetical protein